MTPRSWRRAASLRSSPAGRGCSGGSDDPEGGSPAGDRPSAEVGRALERVDGDPFHLVGEDGALQDAVSAADGRAVAVGSVVDGSTGGLRPLVVESGDGSAWTVVEVGTGSTGEAGSDASLAAASALPDGRFVAIGTRTTSDGTAPALWWRSPDGTWRDPVTPAGLASDGVAAPRSIAAGAAGIMATGVVDGRPAVWTSGDAEEWVTATGVEDASAIAAGGCGPSRSASPATRRRAATRCGGRTDGRQFGLVASSIPDGLRRDVPVVLVGRR